MRQPKGTPTGTNLFAFARHFEGRDVAPARVEAVHLRHLQRCLNAGLCELTPDGKSVQITEAGRAARAAQLARYPTVKRTETGIPLTLSDALEETIQRCVRGVLFRVRNGYTVDEAIAAQMEGSALGPMPRAEIERRAREQAATVTA